MQTQVQPPNQPTLQPSNPPNHLQPQVPFCPNLIDISLLSPAEIKLIDDYHADILRSVTPLLTPAAAQWLRKEAMPLSGGN